MLSIFALTVSIIQSRLLMSSINTDPAITTVVLAKHIIAVLDITHIDDETELRKVRTTVTNKLFTVTPDVVPGIVLARLEVC